MRLLQGKWLLLCFLAALAMPAGATAVLGSSVMGSPFNAVATGNEFISSAANDYRWLLTTDFVTGEDLGVPGGKYLFDNTDGAAVAGETDDVVRHRGYGKAFVIIIVCGGLIRLFTSPAYLKFISEVFNPKASF